WGLTGVARTTQRPGPVEAAISPSDPTATSREPSAAMFASVSPRPGAAEQDVGGLAVAPVAGTQISVATATSGATRPICIQRICTRLSIGSRPHGLDHRQGAHALRS